MSKKSKPLQSAEPNVPVDHQKILGLAVNTLGRNIVWSLSKRTARHGVLPGVYPVIAWAELSRLVGIEQPTMAITLRRMERDGLIQRKPDPDHGRRSHVTLSAKGRKLSQVMRTAAYEVEKLATDGLTAAEVDQFFRLAGIMIQNLNTDRYGRK